MVSLEQIKKNTQETGVRAAALFVHGRCGHGAVLKCRKIIHASRTFTEKNAAVIYFIKPWCPQQ